MKDNSFYNSSRINISISLQSLLEIFNLEAFNFTLLNDPLMFKYKNYFARILFTGITGKEWK